MYIKKLFYKLANKDKHFHYKMNLKKAASVKQNIDKIFNITEDMNLKQNILDNVESKDITKYEHKIQAFIQTYNNRMINNTMHLEN